MDIYILRGERTSGPFFSSKEKVREYLSDPDRFLTPLSESEIEDIFERRHPNYLVVKVTLDDFNVHYKG